MFGRRKADVCSVHRALCMALDVVCKIEATVTRSLVQVMVVHTPF